MAQHQTGWVISKRFSDLISEDNPHRPFLLLILPADWTWPCISVHKWMVHWLHCSTKSPTATEHLKQQAFNLTFPFTLLCCFFTISHSNFRNQKLIFFFKELRKICLCGSFTLCQLCEDVEIGKENGILFQEYSEMEWLMRPSGN